MRSDESTTSLRVAGFLVTALGGLLLGLGALGEWAVVGFPGDAAGNLDASVHGSDLWEGKLALAAGVLALIGVLLMRRVKSRPQRRLGIGIMLLGLVGALVAAETWIRSGSRFAGTDAITKNIENVARALAAKVGRPFPEVLAQVQAEIERQLRIDVKLGLPLTIIGGVLCLAGGALGVAWARGGNSDAGVPQEDQPEAGRADV
jgi:hypothetical protein